MTEINDLVLKLMESLNSLEKKFDIHDNFETSVLKKISDAHVLNGGFDDLINRVDHIKESQSEMKSDITKIKDVMYEPDDGIFSRVRDIEAESKSFSEFKEKVDPDILKEVDRLVQWKSNMTKFTWILGSTTVGLIIKMIFDVITQ